MIEGGRIRLNRWQQAAVAVGSAVGALLNPRRADLIAALGETTGKSAFERVLERMKRSPEGRVRLFLPTATSCLWYILFFFIRAMLRINGGVQSKYNLLTWSATCQAQLVKKHKQTYITTHLQFSSTRTSTHICRIPTATDPFIRCSLSTTLWGCSDVFRYSSPISLHLFNRHPKEKNLRAPPAQKP